MIDDEFRYKQLKPEPPPLPEDTPTRDREELLKRLNNYEPKLSPKESTVKMQIAMWVCLIAGLLCLYQGCS